MDDLESEFGSELASKADTAGIPRSLRWDPRDDSELYLETNTLKPSQWGMVGSNMFKAQTKPYLKLSAGTYNIAIDGHDGKPIFIKKDGKSDDLINFKDSLADKVFKEINSFWKKEKAFKDMGFLHRRGMLFYGPQGTGKTSIVRQIINDIVKNDGIVFFCDNPEAFEKGLTVFREVEEDRPLVCVFEDIDSIIKKYGDEKLLAILDGNNLINRVLNIASTNYPELLDKRIVSRPRRFDRVYKITAPSKAIRTEYLKKKLPKGFSVSEWVKKTTDLSFAGLTETIISVVCLGNNLDKTIEILRNLEKGKPSSEEENETIGFNDEQGSDDE